MAVFGIIAEYNPFHNGHAYQIETIRKSGEHFIVVVMSPNVVQRGDFAVFDKWTRAHAALLCGADLVLELPSLYACATAEQFAFGAVSTLSALGCVDFLSFGSETADLDAIKSAAFLIDDQAVQIKIKEYLKEGMTFAKARSLAVEKMDKKASAVLNAPNDILAVEYIRQIEKTDSGLKPAPILRCAVAHESAQPREGFASASFLRGALTGENLRNYAPAPAAALFNKAIEEGNVSGGVFSLTDALLLKLRLMSAEEISKLPDVSEGLENRILRAAKQAGDIHELCELIKTKRYTMARIRRILMAALLEFPERNQVPAPCYLRVLGHNKKGLELLSRKSASLPVVTSLARARQLGDNAVLLAQTEEKCTIAYGLTLKNKKSVKNEFSTQPIRL